MAKIVLKWNKDLEELFNKLEKSVKSKMTVNSHIVAHAILRLIKNGKRPTPGEVINYIESNYRPPGGWPNFNRRQWLDRVSLTLNFLTNNPKNFFNM